MSVARAICVFAGMASTVEFKNEWRGLEEAVCFLYSETLDW